MAWQYVARFALLVTVLGSTLVHAMGPSWDYADYFRLFGRPHVDESGHGDAARLNLALGDSTYFNAAGDRINARYDRRDIAERLSVASAGFGMHTTGTSGHLFALVNYVWKDRVQYTPTAGGDHASGLGFSVGARWLATSYLSIEPQGGFKGYTWDGFQKVTVAVRLMPHVWATGEFSHNVIHGNEWLAGLRLTWSDYTATTPPNARIIALSGGSKDDLAVGQTLVMLRAVVPQVRPALGAPEMAPLPKDTQIVLRESISNEFGTWWRIDVEGQPEWIRETDLKGRP